MMHPDGSAGADRARRGRFLVLEGIDGAGKSTHLAFIQALLAQKGYSAILTREPGGSPFAEEIRTLVLHQDIDALSELLSVFAARRDHLLKTVWPALERGHWVISDRYVDSSWAYQGAGRGLAAETISTLERWVEEGGSGPDCVFFFDLPAQIAQARRSERALKNVDTPAKNEDRFEREGEAFFERVREGYRQAFNRRGEKGVWIDSQSPIELIQKELEESIVSLC